MAGSTNSPSSPSADPDIDFGVGVEVDSVRRTLTPYGEIDVASAPLLLKAAEKLIGEAVGDMTVDLAAVTFADTGLLHALIDIDGQLRAQGAGLWLVNEPSCVKRLFLASGSRAAFAR